MMRGLHIHFSMLDQSNELYSYPFHKYHCLAAISMHKSQIIHRFNVSHWTLHGCGVAY